MAVSVVICSLYYFFFFFKQKTAYEMRISDWSSDVCSSDLRFGTALMVTVSGLSLALPTQAGELLFASTGDTVVSIGERVSQMKGLKQVRMKGGAVVSILEDRKSTRLNSSH